MRVSVPLTRGQHTVLGVDDEVLDVADLLHPAENRIPPLWSMVPATVSPSTRPPVIGKVKRPLPRDQESVPSGIWPLTSS